MIDFAATTSADGYPCHYFGTRLSTCGTTLHCVGVFTPFGLFERNYDEQGRRLSWDHGKAKYYVDEQRQESVGPGTINEGGAIVTGIEIIEADLKSIHEAQRCLESMKSLQGDRDLRRDFDIVWMDLTTLRTRLQRKLDRLKSEGGAR